MKTLHLTIGAVCAAVAIAAPSSAMASSGYVGALKGPAVVDGVRMNAKQVKQRFASRPLYFVLGSREEASGAIAAFTTPAKRNAYLRVTGRSHSFKPHTARAAYNGNESVFYEFGLLEGDSIAMAHDTSIGNLAERGMPWYRPGENWDNRISSAKTGYWGARLYDLPYLNADRGTLDIVGADSVEIWRWVGWDNVTSSIRNF